MARVAITGVTGFVGSHLAKRLVDSGYSVYGMVRACASRSLEPIKDILNDITLLTADITDFISISHTLRTADPDYICHLAALTPVRLSFEKPFNYEKANYLGTMNVVHAMIELPDYKERKLIAASTAEVYGFHTSEEPLTEDAPFEPSSPYAVSKAAADIYLRMAARVYGLNTVVLRPVNSYGRKFETGFIIEYLITSMLKGKKVCIGAPESIRQYIYVDDHVNAYILAMEKAKGGEAYNIGGGRGIKNRDLAEKIAERIGYDKGKIVFGAYPPGYPLRPVVSDQPYIVLDSTKAKRELNWSPQVDLDEGLEKTIEYWKSKQATR